MKPEFKPVSPVRHRPIKPSYAPANVKELERLEGSNQPPFLLDSPGAIVRSPGAAVSRKDPAALVHRPKGLAVHQHYPVYATPGFISSEPGAKTQPAAKAQAKFRLWWKLPKLKPPKLPKFKRPKLPRLKLPKLALAASSPAGKGKPDSKPKAKANSSSKPSQPPERAAGLAGLKLPKPALSGASFGSLGLGGKSAGKTGGKGSDSFEGDPIAQLLVKVFLTLLILIPFII